MLTSYFTHHLRHILIASLLYVACTIGAVPQSLDIRKAAFLPAEHAFIAEAISESGQTTIVWTIAPGYYLYQHQFQLSASDGNGPATALTQRAEFSQGIKKTDDYFGRVEVHYHQARATIANSDLTAISPEPRLVVTYQGCAEAGLCYPLQHQIINLNLDTIATHKENNN